MEVMLVGLVAINLVLVGSLIFLFKRNSTSTDSSSALLLKQDLTTLTESVHQLKDGLQQQLTDRLDKSNQQMVHQFKESATIIKDVTQKLTNLERTNQQVGDIAIRTFLNKA